MDHVFSDISLLANGGRKRSFLHSPAKAIKSSSRLRTGAVGLAASHSEHLVRLYHFCLSAGSVENLPVLLRQPQDQNQDIERILCCIALFRTVACNFLAEEKNVQYADKNKLFDGLRASMKGDLPYLFIDRWRMARKNGLINERSFEWVPAVDWLVDSLQPEKKPASRRARKPNSPRSPASPSPTSPSPASLPSQPQFSPLPLRQASRGTSLQPGRQAATVHIPKLPDSPSWHVLKARNNKQGGAVHVPGKNRAAELHGRHFAADRHNNVASSPVGRKKERPEKTAKLASTPGVPAVARRQQTLQDMLYLASMGKSLSQTIITVDVVPLAINEEGNADT